jgi:hypothetical protein
LDVSSLIAGAPPTSQTHDYREAFVSKQILAVIVKANGTRDLSPEQALFEKILWIGQPFVGTCIRAFLDKARFSP